MSFFCEIYQGDILLGMCLGVQNVFTPTYLWLGCPFRMNVCVCGEGGGNRFTCVIQTVLSLQGEYLEIVSLFVGECDNVSSCDDKLEAITLMWGYVQCETHLQDGVL